MLALDLNGAVAPDPLSPKRFDLILSNFGALNCVDDIAVLAARLQGWSKPGGVVALNFMGRFCAWEAAYYGLRANSAALRRLRGRARARVGGRDIHIRYWSIGEIRRALGPSFKLVAVHGIGMLLPPSYLFRLVDRFPRLFAKLARLERKASRLWPFSRMADHVLVILMHRTDASAGDQQ